MDNTPLHPPQLIPPPPNLVPQVKLMGTTNSTFENQRCHNIEVIFVLLFTTNVFNSPTSCRNIKKVWIPIRKKGKTTNVQLADGEVQI